MYMRFDVPCANGHVTPVRVALVVSVYQAKWNFELLEFSEFVK